MTDDSQRVRMLAGQLYDASDLELVAMRLSARRLTHAYNHSGPDDRGERTAMLTELLGALGEGVVVEPPFHCDYGVHIRIGAGVYVNFGCVVLDCSTVEIGAGTQVAPRVVISAATHPVDPDERRKGPEMAYPVTIGRNVWIGAGSIVLDDIPPRVLAAGTPCRVIRPL